MKKLTKISAGIAVLALSFAAGCSNSSSGSDDYTIDDPIIQPDDPIVKPGQEYPDFYINEEFGGQKFVADGENWNRYDVDGAKEFADRNAYAQKFMQAKVAELNQMLAGQNKVGLYKEIDTALKNFTTDDVRANYEALAPVFKYMEKDLSDEQFYEHRVGYYKLAAAYNNSLGYMRNSTSYVTNNEMIDSPYSFFAQELAQTKYSYDELTDAKAKQIMVNTLTNVAAQTSTDVETLKKVMNLALYNKSLYGLYNFAGNICHVIDPITERSVLEFHECIASVNWQTNTYNLDAGRSM